MFQKAVFKGESLDELLDTIYEKLTGVNEDNLLRVELAHAKDAWNQYWVATVEWTTE